MPAAGRVVRLRAVVRGKVQGVGFRYWTERASLHFPLTGGRVHNLPDGTVEVEAEAGDRVVLEGLLGALRQGPVGSHVDAVEATWEEDAEPRFTAFRIEGL
jgi:acylphosphatase